MNNKLKEKEIELIWNNLIISNSPVHTTVTKEKLGIGKTDGIIRFYENNTLIGWALQETKRNVGLNSVWFKRSILQSIMYLANVFYDTNPLGLDNLKGVILDSSRYFCFIKKEILIPVMEEFEPLWIKYNRVRPSDAWRIPDLNDWIDRTML